MRQHPANASMTAMPEGPGPQAGPAWSFRIDFRRCVIQRQPPLGPFKTEDAPR